MAPAAGAQEISVKATVTNAWYGSRDYTETNGDRGVDLGVYYTFPAGLQLGGGVGFNKFDEPTSDPSFTAIQAYAQAGWTWRSASRWQPTAGVRLSWEHERVGMLDGGLWAWGYGLGAVGGVSYGLDERFALEFESVFSFLDLDRHGLEPTPSVRRQGGRFRLGGGVTIRWSLNP